MLNGPSQQEKYQERESGRRGGVVLDIAQHPMYPTWERCD